MASYSSSLTPLLRRAAPRLSRYFFPGPQCLHKARPQISPSRLCLHSTGAGAASTQSHIYISTRQTPFLKAFRSQSTAASIPESRHGLADVVSRGEGMLGNLRRAGGRAGKSSEELGSSTKKGFFPLISDKAVAYWLLASAASVYGMVVLGGLTRLTESGLSITEWRPVTGTFPPLSPEAWEHEFSKYRASPEFQKLNPTMTLPEFKQIYYMEYLHRLWGRVIGLTMLLPTVYFVARRKVSLPVARNLLLINAGIGFQGFVGWWMVKSGLKDDLFAKDAHPRVSQYRLTVHLGLAFGVYSAMLWNGLQILRERRLFSASANPGAMLERLSARVLRPFRAASMLTTLLISTTVLSGALVAGLDAGLIYNEFPYMGMGLTPPRSELFSPFYSRLPAPHDDLWWRNMLENPSLVQLDHRILACSTFTAVNALAAYARFKPAVWGALGIGARRALGGMLGAVYVQVALGLATLLYLVPVPLASAHQAGSLAVLTGAIVLGSRVWRTPRMARLVKMRLSASGK